MIPLIYDHAREFSEGRAAVGIKNPDVPDSELWGFIDTTGKLVIPMKYIAVEPFSEGLAIDRNGNYVIPMQDCRIGSFHDGLARFNDGSRKEVLIDKTGKAVTPKRNGLLGNFSEGAAIYIGEGDKAGFMAS